MAPPVFWEKKILRIFDLGVHGMRKNVFSKTLPKSLLIQKYCFRVLNEKKLRSL